MKKLLFLVALVGGCMDNSGPDYPVITPGGGVQPDAAPPIPRSCKNGPTFLNNGQETLTVAFDCGNYDAGHALVTLVSSDTREPFEFDFVCGNNELIFPATHLTLATEIIAQKYDIVCE